MITLTINNKKIKTEKGKTLLEVVREQDLASVPTLCHNEQLEPFTSCFLCVVDVEGARSLSPSCATEATEGMVVHTDSERVIESRRTNLELLLSNHYADCYPPCRIGCPANVDIQGYIALASRGLYREGQILMRETNAFPMVCGRVCAHPCEDHCRRNYVDEPVDIKNIKRFMSDRDLYSEDRYIPETGSPTGKRVAIVGSGPAGLSAAHYLRILGHDAVVFEKLPEPGGMMRYGIPEYRLPKKDLAQEIDIIRTMGADIRCGVELGKDITLDGLEKEYDAVYLAIGAQQGTSMGVPGEDISGVLQGVDFLRDVNLGNAPEIHGHVFIIGGGNTAIDASRTALRAGAEKVTIVYRRTEKEMPADPLEIEDAREEGVDIRILTNPVEYIGSDGRLTSVKLIKMELGEPDASGRRRPLPVEGSEYIEDVDFVIQALGQRVDSAAIEGVETERRGTISIDEELFLTNREGVFAGGDAVTGPYIIIGAVAQGRKAAFVMDRYMRGKELQPENRLGFHIAKEDFGGPDEEEFKDTERVERRSVEKVPAAERARSFTEVELGFTEENLKKEAARCMECGCQDVHECKLREYSGEYDAVKERYIGGDYRPHKYETGHSFIAINTEKCVNCGQCVRVCSEIQKASVFQFDKRGFAATPVPYLYTPLDDTNCISCGLCVSACPVGAIVERLPLGKPGPFENTLTESHCTLCGDACALVVESREGNFIKISSKIKNQSFLDNLCEKGRFGYGPYIKRQDSTITGGGQADVIDYINGLDPAKTLISLSPELTCEEIDLAAAYAKKRNICLYSFELMADREKIILLRDNAVSLTRRPLSRIEDYKKIYYFGTFSEDFNSVSFRQLIRHDDTVSIHTAAHLDSLFFRHVPYASDREMLSHLKKTFSRGDCIAFNLQNIDTSILAELAPFIAEKAISDFFIMNRYINYSYLIDKIGPVKETTEKINAKGFSTLISLNSRPAAESGHFSECLLFTDRDYSGECRFVVPINSMYQKEGAIIDHSGLRKQVYGGAKMSAFALKDFF